MSYKFKINISKEMPFMFSGKMKAVTFSYDDGVTQDIRLAELFHKYGLKATFNINSELLGRRDFLDAGGGRRVTHYKVLSLIHIFQIRARQAAVTRKF